MSSLSLWRRKRFLFQCSIFIGVGIWVGFALCTDYDDKLGANYYSLLFIRPGDNVIITTPECLEYMKTTDGKSACFGSRVHLAKSLDYYEEFVKAESIGDHIGGQLMMIEGKIEVLYPLANAIVLEKEWPMVKVRILEGTNAFQFGWVPCSNITNMKKG